MRLMGIILLMMGFVLVGAMHMIQLNFNYDVMDYQKQMAATDAYSDSVPKPAEPTKVDIFFITVGNTGHFLFLGGILLIGFDMLAARKPAA